MTFYIVKSSVSATCANNRLLVRASDGRLWCSFLWASDVYVAYSDDAGATWTLELVTTPGTTVSYPTMAIDSLDNLHVVWRQKIGADYVIHYRKRNTTGVWDAEEVIEVDPGQQTQPTVAIDSSDNVHVIWESTNDPGLPRTHFIKYRMRTAVGWQAIEFLSDPLPILTYLQRTCLAIGSDDVVHVAWPSQLLGVAAYNIQYKQRTALGWQAQEGVTVGAAFQQLMPQIAIDSSNDIHLTFYGGGWGANPGFYNMRYIKRTAGVWGASEAITDIAADQNFFGSLSYHSIALDVADDIHVVWSGKGWGANPLDRNVQYRCKSGGVWQAQEGLTDRNTHQGSVSLIWAMFPLISGVRTNIPFTGYAFILHGDDWGMDKVEYGPAATLSWELPTPIVINKAYALAREEL